MDKKVINYFDLGSHAGQEIILFLWHINFLRKNGYLKDCVVNIYSFEPSPMIQFLKKRIAAITAYTLKDKKDWTYDEKHCPFHECEDEVLKIYSELFNSKKTSLLDSDVNNIKLLTKALTNHEGKYKLYLSKRIEEYSLFQPEYFKEEDVQPMDYIGSTLFGSK